MTDSRMTFAKRTHGVATAGLAGVERAPKPAPPRGKGGGGEASAAAALRGLHFSLMGVHVIPVVIIFKNVE